MPARADRLRPVRLKFARSRRRPAHKPSRRSGAEAPLPVVELRQEPRQKHKAPSTTALLARQTWETIQKELYYTGVAALQSSAISRAVAPQRVAASAPRHTA